MRGRSPLNALVRQHLLLLWRPHDINAVANPAVCRLWALRSDTCIPRNVVQHAQHIPSQDARQYLVAQPAPHELRHERRVCRHVVQPRGSLEHAVKVAADADMRVANALAGVDDVVGDGGDGGGCGRRVGRGEAGQRGEEANHDDAVVGGEGAENVVGDVARVRLEGET